MTAPNQSDPDGALNPGDFAGFQSMTEADAKTAMTSGAKVSINDAYGSHKVNVVDRIDGNYAAILVADGKADVAVDSATAAINTANSADATAAAALSAVSYWETEFVVASAAVVIGDNELLIGPCQNVPGGLERIVTDMHVAFLTQPNGLTFELKKWSPDGTVSSVLGTYVVPAGATRISWAINYNVINRERLFINVTNVTGSVAPQVLQVLVFGAFVEAD